MAWKCTISTVGPILFYAGIAPNVYSAMISKGKAPFRKGIGSQGKFVIKPIKIAALTQLQFSA